MEEDKNMTELGKMIKILRINKGNISQEKVTTDLGYSSSVFSNIMNGVSVPDIPFIIKCRKYFNLGKKETIELTAKAFQAHKTICLDTSYFTDNRADLLIEVITALLLMPDFNVFNGYKDRIERSVKTITENFNAFEEIRDLSKAKTG
jgi:transcriptional regulator with XRE-family HTH domain